MLAGKGSPFVAYGGGFVCTLHKKNGSGFMNKDNGRLQIGFIYCSHSQESCSCVLFYAFGFVFRQLVLCGKELSTKETSIFRTNCENKRDILSFTVCRSISIKLQFGHFSSGSNWKISSRKAFQPFTSILTEHLSHTTFHARII